MKTADSTDIQEHYNPDEWRGTPDKLGHLCDIYPWISYLPAKNIYLVLWCSTHPKDLPAGYEYYILTCHNEPLDPDWIKQQQANTSGKIYILMPRKNYNLEIPNVIFLPYYEWDHDCAKTLRWFPDIQQREIKYKYSAICNRITQNKIWITTKLLETAKDQSLIVLNAWLQDKNVHNWDPTGEPILDNLTTIFRNKWQGVTISDEYKNTLNHQRHNSNPWQPAYINTALHFNNGGFHYSLMQNSDGTSFIHPGPEVCEKTVKCLLSATPFINCNQFDTYNTLRDFGMHFDYGFDLTWEDDPGNISRFKNIINLIDDLNHNYSAEQIDTQTKESCLHNQHHILSGGLHRICQQQREETVEILLNDLCKS